MDSFISTFHIDWKIIVAQAINFIIVLGILYFLALKPLKKLMSERTERIEKGIKDAATNALVLEQTKKEYDDMINKARTEAQSIFMEAKKEAENKKSEIMEQAKIDADNMIQSGKKILESEKAKILEEAKSEIVSLVVKATEKLLESHVDESYNDKALKQIKKI
jgi:F-type H+-transporting ATPase subunit b